jgi:hypothetical protein
MKTPEPLQQGVRLTAEERRRQGKRSRAIGFALAALCLVFYVITVLKMGSAVLNRSL